jgi:hypothetical protein
MLRRMSEPDHRTPFDERSAGLVDDWSRAVFDECRGWPLAGTGRWYRAEDWLRLRIEAFRGEPLEPLAAIELDTCDHQINLDFGSWCTPISSSFDALDRAAAKACAQARDLVEGWLGGEVKLASYSDERGWRGSKIVYGGELPAAVEPVPVEIGDQGRVIVKTWRRSGWRSWRHMGNGLWLESEIEES